jgi:hypothetical protein
MDEERLRRAEKELGLGPIPEDPAPEIDARTNSDQFSGAEESEESEDEHAGLPWFPSWITLPLLLTFLFAARWFWSVASEYLRYGVLIFSTGPEEMYYVVPFFLNLAWAFIYLFLVTAVKLYRWVKG